MSRLSASSTLASAHEELYAAAADFVSTSANPTYLEQHRTRFRERALRDVTINTSSEYALMDPTNPLLVREEKEAQKDYFRRLKFKYLEQEAKRSFLFSITGDEPQRVMPGENDELEQSNAAKKAKLKATKDEIEAMRVESLALSKTNGEAHAQNAKDAAEAAAIRKQIQDMELELARIKAAHPPSERMTVDEANAKLDAQTDELEQLTEAIGATGRRTDELRDQVARTAKEVLRLARDREREEVRAAQVARGRENGGTRVHDLCGWYAASLSTYRALLGIRAVRAQSDSELVLEYDVPGQDDKTGTPASLTLTFDGAGKLEDAKLTGTEVDVAEIAAAAVENNDAAGLIADVLVRLRPLHRP